MAATSVLNPQLPATRSWRRGPFAAIVVVLTLVAIVAFATIVRSQNSGLSAPVPVNATPAAIQSPTAEMAQLNALLDTPEGQSALAHEFAPGYFGGHPASSQSTSSSPTEPRDSCPVVRGPC